MVMNGNRPAILAVCLLLATPALAEEFTSAAMGLCEKVKSCAMQQLASEELTPEMRQMMQPMLENMCANMQANIGEVPTGHPLYKPAIACMRSMEQLSCERMQDSEGMQTPECDEYQALVEQQGGTP
jgi:hypothetical protein